MSTTYLLVWAVFAPPLAGAAAALLFLLGKALRPRSRGPVLVLDVLVLAAACAGPLLQALLVLTGGHYSLPDLGFGLAVRPISAMGTVAVDAALVCLLLFPVYSPDGGHNPRAELQASITAVSLCGMLLSGAMLLDDTLAQVFCLLGASLAVAGYALRSLVSQSQQGQPAEPSYESTLRVVGAIKYVCTAAAATMLLAAGSLFIARFPLHMENAAALGAGAGILSVGLVIRAGGTPFSGGLPDFARSAPRVSVLALGALTPAALVAGVGMLSPVAARLTEVSAGSRQIALALGVAVALLSGLRALAASRRDASIPLLYAASAGVQVGWALFGVLSHSAVGTAGAVLIAANLAISVPLMASLQIRRHAAAVAGAAALLGLPPFGGFVGALLVGSAAVQIGGGWLVLLLIGPALAATAWFRIPAALEGESKSRLSLQERLYCYALVGAQFVLLIVSAAVAGSLISG